MIKKQPKNCLENTKWILLIVLATMCAGCVNDFVGNSPMERAHRKQLQEDKEKQP